MVPWPVFAALAVICLVLAALRIWGIALAVGVAGLYNLARSFRALRWTLPRRVAGVALATPWRRSSRSVAPEETTERLLVALAGKHPSTLASAERFVRESSYEPGDKSVALDRLRSARRMLNAERAAVRVLRVRRLRLVFVSTVWAIIAAATVLMFLGDNTPGPVLQQPWRMWAAVATSAVTGSLLAVKRMNHG